MKQKNQLPTLGVLVTSISNFRPTPARGFDLHQWADQNLGKEFGVIRVRYRNRDEARADLFEYIEVFYNRKRRHGYLGNISPVDFEKQSIGSF